MNPYIREVKSSRLKVQGYDVLKIGLFAPREVLYKKVNARTYLWIKDGIVEEVKRLIKSGNPKKRIKMIGLQYREIIKYLDGEISEAQLVVRMQTVTRQYAKRQQTWFKNVENVNWFDITDKNYLDKVEKMIAKWYDLV